MTNRAAETLKVDTRTVELSRRPDVEEALVDLCGRFTAHTLASAGLLEVAEAILVGAPLDAAHGASLSRASLPILGKLIDLRTLVAARAAPSLPAGPSLPPPARARALVVLPLAELLETDGLSDATEKAVELVIAAYSRAAAGASDAAAGLFDDQGATLIALDRWVGTFNRDELLSAIGALLSALEPRGSFSIFGPTTGELKQMLREREAPPSRLARAEVEPLRGLAQSLLECGVRTVEGGGDLDVHAVCVEAGFFVTVTHDLSRLRIPRDVSTRNDAGRSIVDALIEARDRLRALDDSRGGFAAWSPWLPAVLDATFRGDSPLGLEVLSSIAIARLLLPRVSFIAAPLSLLGPNAAEVAHSFGANDLGLFALDSTSASQLGISELDSGSAALYQRIRARRPAAMSRKSEEQDDMNGTTTNGPLDG